MSRAFIKEDVEISERSGRRRSPAGLPPGAKNYITQAGVERLRARLSELQATPQKNKAEIARLEAVLDSVSIVEPEPRPEVAVFGSTVTLMRSDGVTETYRIAGVDEEELEQANVSWVSPIGKILLGTKIGQRLKFPDQENMTRTVLGID